MEVFAAVIYLHGFIRNTLISPFISEDVLGGRKTN